MSLVASLFELAQKGGALLFVVLAGIGFLDARERRVQYDEVPLCSFDAFCLSVNLQFGTGVAFCNLIHICDKVKVTLKVIVHIKVEIT